MQRKKITLAQLSKFVIPSVIGILLFLVPFKIGGEPILVINLIINKTKALLGKALLLLEHHFG